MRKEALFMCHMNSAEKYLKFQTTSYMNLSMITIHGLIFVSSMAIVYTCFSAATEKHVLIAICLLFVYFKHPVLQNLSDLRSE
jgi:hypothetical protein